MNPGRHGACLVPDRIHIDRPYKLCGLRCFIDTNKNTNIRVGVGVIGLRERLAYRAVPPESKYVWRFGDKRPIRLVSLVPQGCDYLQVYLQSTHFLGDNVGDIGSGNGEDALSFVIVRIWSATRKVSRRARRARRHSCTGGMLLESGGGHPAEASGSRRTSGVPERL